MDSVAKVQKEYLKFCYRELGDTQLKMTDMLCILFLNMDSGLDASVDIAKRYSISPSLVSKSVDRLRCEGYLSAERDVRDSRRWHLRLTPSCAPITAKLDAAHELFLSEALAGITEDERAVMAGAAEKLRANLDRIKSR